MNCIFRFNILILYNFLFTIYIQTLYFLTLGHIDPYTVSLSLCLILIVDWFNILYYHIPIFIMLYFFCKEDFYCKQTRKNRKKLQTTLLYTCTTYIIIYHISVPYQRTIFIGRMLSCVCR